MLILKAFLYLSFDQPMIAQYIDAFARLLARYLPFPSEFLATQITLAPENVEGDLAFPCFRLAKELGKNPAQIATETLAQLNGELQGEQHPLFLSFVAVGPYINAHLHPSAVAQQLLHTISTAKERYGAGTPTEQKILLEGRQPNTHKAIHIGHIRNILLSESVARVLSFAGNKVIKCCYPGDIGAHVAKRMRYYLNFYPQQESFPTENFTRRVGQLYTEASKKVEENPDNYKAQIETLQKQLEEGDPSLQKLWQETRELCLSDMKKIFAELGSEQMDKRYYESELEQPGIQIVKQMLQEGIAEISQGATAINLEQWNLGRFLLLKSTGASLYSTKDIALAYQKRADFPDYDISLYVVGSEQEYHFQQLFKTLECIGFDPQKLRHLSYGLIDLKTGKMSSREGNVILYEDFRDTLLQHAKTLLQDRSLPASDKPEIARKIAFAAMKFSILLQDSEKRITFDETQALSFEGETGPYLQYTLARLQAILNKRATIATETPDLTELSSHYTNAEIPLLLHLAQFPDAVQKAAQSYKPNYIARYALDLAQLANAYYQKHKILDEAQPMLTTARILLIQGVVQVGINAFALLGIEEVQQM